MTEHLTSYEQLLVGSIFIGFVLYWEYTDCALEEAWHSFSNKKNE